MQVMRLASAPARLTHYIRLYAHLQGSFGDASLIYPVPARATPLLAAWTSWLAALAEANPSKSASESQMPTSFAAAQACLPRTELQLQGSQFSVGEVVSRFRRLPNRLA